MEDDNGIAGEKRQREEATVVDTGCGMHKRSCSTCPVGKLLWDGLLYGTELQPSDLHTSDLHITKDSSYPKWLPHMTETVPNIN